MKRFLILVAALTMGAVLGWAAPTQAAPITYTATSMASGTLGRDAVHQCAGDRRAHG